MLTRDRELLKRRSITHGCYVRALKSAGQFREVFDRLDLARSVRPFTLCLHCNAPLSGIEKAEVEGRVPERVFERYSQFSTCHACGRVYWEGSHWRRMMGLLGEVMSTDL